MDGPRNIFIEEFGEKKQKPSPPQNGKQKAEAAAVETSGNIFIDEFGVKKKEETKVPLGSSGAQATLPEKQTLGSAGSKADESTSISVSKSPSTEKPKVEVDTPEEDFDFLPDRTTKDSHKFLTEIAKRQDGEAQLFGAPKQLFGQQQNDAMSQRMRTPKASAVFAGNPDAITDVINYEKQKIDREIAELRHAESQFGSGGATEPQKIRLQQLRSDRQMLLRDGVKTIQDIYATKWQSLPNKTDEAKAALGSDLRKKLSAIDPIIYNDLGQPQDASVGYTDQQGKVGEKGKVKVDEILNSPAYKTFPVAKPFFDKRIQTYKTIQQENDYHNRAAINQSLANKDAETLDELLKTEGVKNEDMNTPEANEAITIFNRLKQYQADNLQLLNRYPQVKKAYEQNLVSEKFAEVVRDAREGKYGVAEKFTSERNLLTGNRLNQDWEIKAVAEKTGLSEDKVREYADKAKVPSFLGLSVRSVDKTIGDLQQGINRLTMAKDDADVTNREIFESQYHAPAAFQLRVGGKDPNVNFDAIVGTIFEVAPQALTFGVESYALKGLLNATGKIASGTVRGLMKGTDLRAFQAAERLLPADKFARLMVRSGVAESEAAAMGKLTNAVNRAKSIASVYTPGYLTSYEGAYQQAAQFSNDEKKRKEYAGQVANANAVSELIFNDADFAEKILKRVPSQDVFRKYINDAVPFGTKDIFMAKMARFAQIIGYESAEELWPVIKEALAKEEVFDYQTSSAEFFNQALNTVVTTAIGTMPMGALGASRLPTSDLVKQSIYEAGRQSEKYKAYFDQQVDEGKISNEERNKANRAVNTIAKITDNLPEVNAAGRPLTQAEKNDIVYREVQNGALRKLEKDAPVGLQKNYTEEIKENQAVIDEAMTTEEKEDVSQDISRETSEGGVEINDLIKKAIDDKVITGMNVMTAEAALQSEENADLFLQEIADQALNRIAPDAVTSEEAMDRAKSTYGEDLVKVAIEKYPVVEETKISPQEEKKDPHEERGFDESKGDIDVTNEGEKLPVSDQAVAPVSSVEGKEVEDIYFMSGDELNELQKETKAEQKQKLIDVVGKDWYDKYSSANNEEKSRMENALTDEQKEVFGGIGLSDNRNPEIIKDLRKKIVAIETTEDKDVLGSRVRQAVTDLANDRNQKESVAILNAVGKRAEELGFDKKEIQDAAISDLRERVGDQEAADILNTYFNKETATSQSQPSSEEGGEPGEILPQQKTETDETTDTKGSAEDKQGNESLQNQKSDTGESTEAIEEATEVPPTKPTEKDVVDDEFENKPKSILNRINSSKNVSESFKEKFKSNPKDLRYDPQSHEIARQLAKEIVDEFGTEDAVAMAESGRFDGDVNSMIFAESIDRTYQQEQDATTQAEKIKFAEQWADYAIRYDETARQKGKFISAIYDFYKKSPLGVVLSERAKRDMAFKEWFQKREGEYKEVFEAIKDEPEFKEFVAEKVKEGLKEERQTVRQKRRAKITEIFDKGKIKGDNLSSSLIPPGIWNAAVELMKQTYLAGESIAYVIEQGINYIKTNYKEAWDEKAFTDEWNERLSGIDGNKIKTDEDTQKKQQERILDRFRKKLSGLSDQQKEDVIRKSFKKLVENRALEYDEFKKIIADVLGLGEMTAEEITKLNGLLSDINAVQDAADNVMSQEKPEDIKNAIRNFDVTAKKAEHSAKKLAGMLYNKPDVGQRVRSMVQLNTLGIFSLIKNVGYNVFNQLFVRIPKAIYGTVIDQAIYGLSFLSNKITGSPIIKPDVNIFLAQKGYFSKGAEGGAQAIKQIFTGLTNKDYFQKEVYTSQIKPWTSIKDLWNWGRGNRFLSKAQIADKALQATVGIPAEIIARGLNVGDKPFRYAAEGAAATTIGKQQLGLSGIELERFIRFPKEAARRVFVLKGMSDEQATKKAESIESRIISEGEAAVFQQDNIINDVLNGLKNTLKPKDGSHPLAPASEQLVRTFGLLNLPYVKTPVNIMWEFFNLMNPEIALFQSFIFGIKAAKSGSREDFIKAKKWLSHAATGYSILAATAYIASIGALGGDDDDEAYKAKEAKGKATYEKPHTINYSKLQRAGLGGSTETKGGDVVVDLSWLGPLGSVMNFQANKYENMTEEERNSMAYVDDLLMRLQSGARDGLVNTTFRGAFDAVDAITSGRTDNWILNMMNVATNLVEPATIAQISRQNRKEEYQVKGDTFSEKLENSMKARFFGKLKPKKNVWGENIEKGNPIKSMLGVYTYNGTVTNQPIHKDFKRTGNADFYPPALSGSMTVDGVSRKMNTEQLLQMETLVGQARKTLSEPFVNGSATVDGKSYRSMNDDEKLDALKDIYTQGYNIGKAKFQELYPEFQKQKK